MTPTAPDDPSPETTAPPRSRLREGDGFVAAARHPVQRAERVGGLLIKGFRSVDFEATAVWLNGSSAIRLDIGGQVDAGVSLAVENGRITRIYAIRNPPHNSPASTWSPLSPHPDGLISELWTGCRSAPGQGRVSRWRLGWCLYGAHR